MYKIRIEALENKLFDRAMFTFFCFKYENLIYRVLLSIELGANKTVLLKNEYLTYSYTQIQVDLKNIKINYRDSSNLELMIHETTNFEKQKQNFITHISAAIYIIVEYYTEGGEIRKPVEFDQELWETLTYIDVSPKFRLPAKKLEQKVPMLTHSSKIIKKYKDEMLTKELEETFQLTGFPDQTNDIKNDYNLIEQENLTLWPKKKPKKKAK